MQLDKDDDKAEDPPAEVNIKIFLSGHQRRASSAASRAWMYYFLF